jgi:hypothetical protein
VENVLQYASSPINYELQGAECKFRHEIPDDEDEARLDQFHDVFGRDRHSAHKGDMSGVGSFLRNTKSMLLSKNRMF